MRRQARKSVGGALIVRSASALQVWLWLLLFVFQNEFRISWSIKPGYLDYDNLPETNFTCTGKVIGGYYADLETSCQMFHVCTIGQQNEPMDIKFLCLNGTVFDQETRVCERVDEVDCTKSEKFYSLNLELYGSTVPPIIPPEPANPHVPETDQTQKQNKTNTHIILADPYISETPTTSDKTQNQPIDTIDSTEDPVQEYKKEEPKNSSNQHVLPSKLEVDLNDEYEEEEEEDEAIDNENSDFDEDYSHPLTTTTIQIVTSTTTTTKKSLTSSTTVPPPSSNSPFIPPLITTLSPLPPSSAHPSFAPSISPSSTLDPSLLSPQEFIYRHREPGTEAISFQRQSFRPADGVYITHAPPQQFDHFQYESSRTAPRPVVSHPAPFQRPSPAPFRPTTIDPHNQILRPVANSQSSERHETTIKHRPQNYPAHLPSQQSLPFNPFYFDRKRSDDIIPENKSSLSARSVAPPTETERTPNKPKSPPRVIVTASASVSDSNGKRLNYTVGNVVSAVKPIVPINYDDYKESDLIFDPFFLDVPKLQPRRKTRSNNFRKIISVPASTVKPVSIMSEKFVTTVSPETSQATTVKASSFTQSPTTTIGWNPQDYVDDNYEPHAYMPPVPPLAVLLSRDYVKSRKHDRQSVNTVTGEKTNELKSSHVIQSKSTLLEAQKISSQNVGTEAAVPVTSPSPFGAPTCVTSHSTDCRTRA